MSFRADFYEALTWMALEDVYKKPVLYEPVRERHTCGTDCEYAKRCKKPETYTRLIYTIPDFLVETTPTRFFHVCYWDSKETSHAKFWRTMSELADLKRYIPKCKSTCVVFEARFEAGQYLSSGWYSDFLRAFRELFDYCAFFDHPNLSSDLEFARSLRAAGTIRIFEALRRKKPRLKSLDALKSLFAKPLSSTTLRGNSKEKLWRLERAFCYRINPVPHSPTHFERLRNAMLQCVLIHLLLPKRIRTQELIIKMRGWREGVRDAKDLVTLKLLRTLPIDERLGRFSFLLKLEEDLSGDTSVIFSDDITLFLDALRAGIPGLPERAICEATDRTCEVFARSAQVMEAITTISDFTAVPDIDVLRKMTATGLWRIFTAIPITAQYNSFAEFLIEASGLGTYPLVAAINREKPSLTVTRNDIRGLYGNRRPKANPARYAEILAQIVKLIPANVDLAKVGRRYLLRKTHRIIGAQSAVNPLEELVRTILESHKLAFGVTLISDKELPTLVGDCAESAQAGAWRVSLGLRQGRQTIPIFMSGMKNPADCGHKTREFCGHLVMARYRWRDDDIVPSDVRRGIAILEGSYGPEEGQAFELAGYAVCSIAGITSALRRLDLLANQTSAPVRPPGNPKLVVSTRRSVSHIRPTETWPRRAEASG